MTIKIEVECDGRDCCNSVEMDGYADADIKYAGYFQDPTNGESHYCYRCWPKVQKEIEEESLARDMD